MLRKNQLWRSRNPEILGQTVKTALGNRSYKDLLRVVYRPLGLEVNPEIWNGIKEYPFLPLVTAQRMPCDEIFKRWLVHNDKPAFKGPPPRKIPQEVFSKFTLNNLTRLKAYYFGTENKNMAPITWKAKDFSDREAQLKIPHLKSYGTYGEEGLGVVRSMRENPPRGKGLIIGSLSPWVEAIALHFGASELLTVEYSKLNIEHDKVGYVHPVKLAKNWRKYAGFDFVASFSSIEHSGLGRFGDRLDPFGDFWELQKANCLMKPGGIFYLGIPTGADSLEWNAHRVYGHIRWPIIAADWDVLGLSREEFQNIINSNNQYQPMIRLQKPKDLGSAVES